MIRQRKVLTVVDNCTTNVANTKPKKILPTSPIKTFACGKLNGKNPRQADANAILIRAVSGVLLIKDEKIDRRPKPITPVNPAMPFIPSMKL